MESKEIKALLQEKFHLEIRNSCNCMGQYYAEDDWALHFWGETEEDIIQQLCKALPDSKISPSSQFLTVDKVVILPDYNNSQLVLEEGETIKGIDLIELAMTREEYKRNVRNAEAREKRKKEKEREEAALKRDEEERKIYEALKTKYENS
jgi:hypothetical protein